MAEIKLEEIKNVALKLINKGQANFNISDSHEALLYTLAYYDGVLDLLEEIEDRLFPTIKKFDPEEAADEREQTENL